MYVYGKFHILLKPLITPCRAKVIYFTLNIFAVLVVRDNHVVLILIFKLVSFFYIYKKIYAGYHFHVKRGDNRPSGIVAGAGRQAQTTCGKVWVTVGLVTSEISRRKKERKIRRQEHQQQKRTVCSASIAARVATI